MFHVTPLKALKYAITAPDSAALLGTSLFFFTSSAAGLLLLDLSEGLEVCLAFLALLSLGIATFTLVSGYRLCYAMKGKYIEAARARRILSGNGLQDEWATGPSAGLAGMSSASMSPQFNTNGLPMIEGTMLDIHGNTFGHVDTSAGMSADSVDSYNSPFGS